jgi:hypothetical protein
MTLGAGGLYPRELWGLGRVVFPSPVFYQYLCLGEGREDLPVEELIP